MKLEWLGHSAWLIENENTKVLIDPFISGNPSCPTKVSDLKDINFIIVTHNHMDHLGDTVEISNATGAKVISMFENVNTMQKNGLKAENGIGINKGSSLLDFGDIKVAFVDAIHSGNEAGVVLEIGKKKIYHAGDTAFFSDMQLIKKFFEPDVAMLPIGGYFTMGIEQAIEAAKAIGAKITFPMHYNTFPQIKQNPLIFKEGLEGLTEVVILDPGESYEI